MLAVNWSLINVLVILRLQIEYWNFFLYKLKKKISMRIVLLMMHSYKWWFWIIWNKKKHTFILINRNGFFKVSGFLKISVSVKKFDVIILLNRISFMVFHKLKPIYVHMYVYCEELKKFWLIYTTNYHVIFVPKSHDFHVMYLYPLNNIVVVNDDIILNNYLLKHSRCKVQQLTF